MLWYLIWSWLAFCFLLTLVVRTQPVTASYIVWWKLIFRGWQVSLLILMGLFIYTLWVVLLAPAVQLFSLSL